jgi:hypothetical protein
MRLREREKGTKYEKRDLVSQPLPASLSLPLAFVGEECKI